MALALLALRLLLAGTFLLAAATKAIARADFERSVRDFGVPGALAPALSVLFPLAEAIIAMALLPASTAWWGAAGALGLLVLFTAAILGNLAFGRTPDCNCFGQVSRKPIGATEVVRNFLLIALAIAILLGAARAQALSAIAWIATLGAVEGALLALALGGLALAAWNSWLIVQLMEQGGRLLVRIETLERGAVPGVQLPAAAAPAGLPVGTAAPPFEAPLLAGGTATLETLRLPDRPLLLAFTDPQCGPCNDLLPEIAEWQRNAAGRYALAIVTRGTAEANRAKVDQLGLAPVLLQREREVMEAYQSSATPSMVAILPDATVGSALAQGAAEIQDLVRRVAAGERLSLAPLAMAGHAGHAGAGVTPCPHCGQVHAPAGTAAAVVLPVGSAAPDVELTDLKGQRFSLARRRGAPQVLVFWNTTCGFCDQILPDLKAIEAGPAASRPGIVVVSAGTAEANAAQGLRSTVLLDQEFATGRAFGAEGTPSAVLVDADGRIASRLAVGGPEVLALLRGESPE